MPVVFEKYARSACCCTEAVERRVVRWRLLRPCKDFGESVVDVSKKVQRRSGRNLCDLVVGCKLC